MLYIVICILVLIIGVLVVTNYNSHKEHEYCTTYKNINNDIQCSNKNDTLDIITIVDGIDNQAIGLHLSIYLKVQKLDKLSKDQKYCIKGYDNIQQIQTIVMGETRALMATMSTEEICANRDKFLANVFTNIEQELIKIGYDVISIHMR